MTSSDKLPAPKPQQIPYVMKFVLGGLAGMSSTCIVQPVDLIKTRMQISGMGSAEREFKNSFHCLQTVITKEGPLALYEGITAGLLRQATYTTGRLGIYTSLNENYKLKYNEEPGLLIRMSMGVVAGAFGAFIGTPSGVALIRMTSDGQLPVEERRNYTCVLNAFTRIIKEEGFTTLWRGCVPTILRAMVANMVQLAVYSQAKSILIRKVSMTEGIKLHFVAAMISGLATATASLPVDILKTRLQNMKYIDGKPKFSGSLDVFSKVIKQEGVSALWKGFTPYYCRIGPHTVLTFIFLEYYNKWYFKYVMGISGDSSL